MENQVRCRFCGKVYDLGKVEIIARYADCTVFKTPCCGKEADDRSWKGDFMRIETECDVVRCDEEGRYER